MKIMIELDIPDRIIESVVKGILENYPEAALGSCIQCIKWKYDDWQFEFIDSETGEKYSPTKDDFLKVFPSIFTAKWPKGCTRPPSSTEEEIWDEWLGQCDATDFDAFIQLVCLGEVIYG